MPDSAVEPTSDPRLRAVFCLLLTLGCGSEPPPTTAEAPAEAAETTQEAAAVPGGEVVAISGPGGLRSPALPPGTFMGPGGRLEAGQSLETPKGTLAELRLETGVRIRMNEDTALSLPGSGAASRLVLTRGEIVVLTEPGVTADLAVAAGDEVLTVAQGEAQIRHDGGTRRFAVVVGRAELQAPTRSLTLSAGESIEAPLPEERARVPELSLAPLRETGWSRTFETAAQIAKDVPAGVGSLTARRPGSQAQRQHLRLTDQTVHVSIAGRVAHTEIEQAFFNDQPAVLEGTYRFPLPGDGSVSGLGLLVGNRWMDGEIVEKTRARRIFKSIVDATIPRDPALLEWEQGNLFKLRVFPIPGRGERRVRLSYTQVLPVADDMLRYRFPLAGSGAGGTEIEHFEFRVTVDGEHLDEATLSDIGTPMMELERTIKGSQVQLHADREHFVPTADIGVDIPIPPSEAEVHTATHLDRDGQAYFMVSMQPELELPRPEGPTSFAFVLDRSHSMSPELWTVARGMVEALATSMEPEDRFAVLACDTACDEVPGGMLTGEPGDLDEMKRFLDAQDLAGASDLGGMLTSAAETLERGGASGERVIVYLGDGTPSSGEMAADRLAEHVATPLRGTRVMAVALGSRSDLTTLGAIVKQTGGDILLADPRDDRLQLVRELRLRARVPVAHDIEIDVPDGMVAVHRHGTDGLRPGDTLVVLGKLSRPVHDDVVIRAQGPEGPIERRFRVDLEADRDSPVEHRHLPRTWGQAEIAHLTQTKGFDAREDIVALSKHYTVMSRHTSLLVLENDAMYREFNVVRAAKNTDKWKGDLSKTESKTQADAGSTGKKTATAAPETVTTEELGAAFNRQDPAAAGGEGREREKSEDVDELLDPVPEPEPDPQPSPPPSSAPTVPNGISGGVLGGVPGGVVGGSGSGNHSGFAEPEEEENRKAAEVRPQQAPKDVGDDFSEDDDLSDVEFGDEDVDAPAIATGRTSGSSKSGSRGAPAKTDKPKKKKRKPASKSPMGDDFGGGGGWGDIEPKRPGGGWGGHRPVRQLKSRPLSGPPSARTLARIEDLRRAVAADPTQRGPHGKLVRAALRAGDTRSLDFARAWAEVDPDHAPALMSLADAMAADGDPMALRAYESALEVKPFVRRHHAELARAFESRGDMTRACSHRRAVVSIDPKDGDHHADLSRCLERARRHTDALDALADGHRRAITDTSVLSTVGAELSSGSVPAASFSLHSGAQLSLTLTWAGEDDLDLAVVDAKGRRLSGSRPQGKARVRESEGREQLTLKKVRKSVFVEVTRRSATRDRADSGGAPIRGELTIKTPSGTRHVPVTVRDGTVRVAKVFWITR
ncbi:MAG: VIT domain-containing protein [Myxococcota bacterium]